MTPFTLPKDFIEWCKHHGIEYTKLDYSTAKRLELEYLEDIYWGAW